MREQKTHKAIAMEELFENNLLERVANNSRDFNEKVASQILKQLPAKDRR